MLNSGTEIAKIHRMLTSTTTVQRTAFHVEVHLKHFFFLIAQLFCDNSRYKKGLLTESFR